MLRKIIILLLLTLVASATDINPDLEKQFKQIDDEFSGNLGVYVKDLTDGTTVNYNTDRNWYLASTVKIPIGIAILQKVEEGELNLDDELTLQESDFVDGSGDLMWREPGSSYTVLELMKRMIRDSDSTATDMLIRFLGEEEFNQHVQDRIISEGLEQITTILQVRYDAYGELHKNAANLSNIDIIKLKGVTPMSNRLDELLRIISVDKNEISVNTIPDAFEKYYARELNSGNLESMGTVLENLAQREYLNEVNTRILLDIMKSVNTGERRIKAGLPQGAQFAHKTGTQIGRACNMGIVYPESGEETLVVAACVEQFDELREAENVLQKVGNAISVEL